MGSPKGGRAGLINGGTSVLGSTSMSVDVLERGACTADDVDPEIFFPDPRGGGGAPDARKVCGRCDVRRQCLEYALRIPALTGVWGGYTHAERSQEIARRENGDDDD